MFIMLYGPDTFRSKQHLKKMIAEFKVKRDPAGLNTVIFDAEKVEGQEILEAIMIAPFMAEKRLTVIEKLSAACQSALRDELLGLLKKKKLPDSAVVIVWEAEVKLNSHALFTALAKQKFSQKFEMLKGAQLSDWIQQELASRGLAIESAALAKLANYQWLDLWHLHNELEKMAAYFSSGADKTVNSQELRLFLEEAADDNVFHFIDALLGRRAKEAVRLLHAQWESGESEHKLFGLIASQWRNLLRLKDYAVLNPGMTSDQAAVALDLHPFVVRKTLAILPGFSFERLKEIYQELLEIDIKTKTGEGRLKHLLELLIAKICF